MLNFIKPNLYNCSKEIKSKAYLTLVHPILEYTSSVWDPQLIKYSDQIEKVQRAAAHWVTSDSSWSSSVTVMLNNLNWPTLLLHHKISKLQIFCKSIYNLTALPIPDYFLHVTILLDLHGTITAFNMSSHHQTLIHTSLVFSSYLIGTSLTIMPAKF